MGKKRKNKTIPMQRWVGQVKQSEHDGMELQMACIDEMMPFIRNLVKSGYEDMGRGFVFFPGGVTLGAPAEIERNGFSWDGKRQDAPEGQIPAVYMPFEDFKIMMQSLQKDIRPEYRMPQGAMDSLRRRVDEYNSATDCVLGVYRTDHGLNVIGRTLDD